MTSTEPLGTIASVDSLLAATIYHGNHDRNHKSFGIPDQLETVQAEFLLYSKQNSNSQEKVIIVTHISSIYTNFAHSIDIQSVRSLYE